MNDRQDLVGAAVVAAALGAGLTGRMDGAWMVAGVALAGAGAGWFRSARWMPGAAAALIGGWLVARFALSDARPLWMAVAGIVTMAAVAAGIGRAGPAGVSGRVVLACLAVTCGGVWACVPETDGAGRLGLVLGLGAAASAILDLEIAVEVVGAGAAALLYVALAGGQYRPTAVVGALASFGLLAVAWCGEFVRFVPRLRSPLLRVRLVRDGLLVGGHALAVAVVSRIAGRGANLSRAVIIATVAGAALVVGMATVRQERRAA